MAQANGDIVPIPQPPVHALGFLGNLPDLDSSFALKSFWGLHALYGDIVKLDLLKAKAVLVSNHALIHEVCDDDRFEKFIGSVLKEVRSVAGDALFTAYPHELNWHKAHRTLMPVFGPMGVKKMFAEQLDVASQLVLRWDRLGPDNLIDTGDDFTRLAFDTIGLCAFNYRFNNFYADRMHPFADQMAEVLVEAGKRANRTSVETALRVFSAAHLQENIQSMHKLCDDLIAERKAHPKPEINDLLNTMLNVADPVTGEKLSDENIRYQMVTFLIAGHETTSGTLAFLFYNFLKHPDTLLKAQQEVDQVLGDNPIEFKHLSQLKYIDWAIKETLRLNGPIGALVRHAKQDTVIGGKYKVSANDSIICNLKGLHTDPKVWGDDAQAFRPDRMKEFASLPPDAWKPFGSGIRSCIGRAFAEQEMIMNVALILQRFQVEMVDPSYELAIKSTLTMKPEGFHIKVRRRVGKDSMVGISSGAASVTRKQRAGAQTASAAKDKKKMICAYGSNAGTCKAFAEELQTAAPEFGFEVEVVSLDQATESLSKDKPTVVITSSYEGKPPDNAKKFVSWLENESSSASLQGIPYAIFGVGNSEWASTYHKVPRNVRGQFEKKGGKEICEPTFADVKEDATGDWEDFMERLWKALQESGQAGASEQRSQLQAQVFKHDMPSMLGGKEMSWGLVKSVKALGGEGVGPSKRELEVQLPPGVGYETGDYLVVLPYNPSDTVVRLLVRFGLHADDLVNISGTRKAFLQSKEPITAFDFFMQRVELQAAATQRQIEILASHSSESSKAALHSLASEANFKAEVIGKNYSILDILEDHPDCTLPLSAYIDMLKPLAPRQYSISSSPLAAPHQPKQDMFTATVTYDVHDAPARSGSGRTFHGVASSYMSRLRPGERIHCHVRRTNAAFRLPSDSEVPVIMFAAGTGIAPMRGFIQERAAISSAGAKKVGKAVLYFGCRDFEKDYIYKDELAQWEKDGAVEVRPTFSKRGPTTAQDTYKYVGERVWADREELASMFKNGAKILLCGSASKLAKSTAEVLKKIWLEHNAGKTAEEAEEWLEAQREIRYVTDVFD